jgi:hypothetical protein
VGASDTIAGRLLKNELTVNRKADTSREVRPQADIAKQQMDCLLLTQSGHIDVSDPDEWRR